MNRFLCPSSFPALALGLALSFGGVWAEASPATETLALPGLSAPGEILIDRWGVPHIYAQKHYDAFFLQGFNAARDRLWQIDLWRRRGLGELAEVFGPGFVAQDAAARQFLYRGSLFREWLAYGSDAQAMRKLWPVSTPSSPPRRTMPPRSSCPNSVPRAGRRKRGVHSATAHGATHQEVPAPVVPGRSRRINRQSPRTSMPTVPEGLIPGVPEGVGQLRPRLPWAQRSGDQLALAQELEARGICARRGPITGTARATRPGALSSRTISRSHALPSLRYIAHRVRRLM